MRILKAAGHTGMLAIAIFAPALAILFLLVLLGILDPEILTFIYAAVLQNEVIGPLSITEAIFIWWTLMFALCGDSNMG